MDAYISHLLQEKDPFLSELRQSALSRNVPIVREDTASLIKVLVAEHKPRRVLETGTAVGYSAIMIAKARLAADRESPLNIDTVEISPDMVTEARHNIASAGLEDKINTILGDAAEVLACLSGKYDLIFIDSAKSQYAQMYDDIKRLLAPGGLLICDNVIFYGKIYDAPADAPHKHRTIVTNMRNFLERLTADKEFNSAILETGDGVALAYYRGAL